MPHTRSLLMAAAVLAAVPSTLLAAPSYAIDPIGLAGSGYTLAGTATVSPTALNAVNQVIGTSIRYSGASYTGQAAWFYDPTTHLSTPIGFTGGVYTDSSGFQSSTPDHINDAGQAIGISSRFTPAGDDRGQSAWFYNSSFGTLAQMGFTSGQYNSTDGTQFSSTLQLFSTPIAAGNSTLYSGTDVIGSTGWIYDRAIATTTAIGLGDAPHTASPSGFQSSEALFASSAGTIRVTGTSRRYTGNTDTGQDAWLYTAGSGTVAIGFTDPSLYTTSAPTAISNTGVVIGTSQRVTTSTLAAWRYTASTSTLETLGLTDPAHQSPSGQTSSTPDVLNDAGDAAGTSVQYVGGFPQGQSAWVQPAGASTATKIGLYSDTFGPAFADPSGVHSSTPERISANGVVAGISERFSGSASNGQGAWVYNPITSSTSRVGLTDANFTDPSTAYQSSEISDINATGQTVGYSLDNAGDPVGWYYDPATDTTTPLASPGVLSDPLLIGDDGVVLGTYSSGAILNHAFYWTLSGGLIDLGSLVNGGLPANWQSLTDALQRNAAGSIIGDGLATGQPDGSAAYLLTIPVPEPASLALLALGSACLLTRRKR